MLMFKFAILFTGNMLTKLTYRTVVSTSRLKFTYVYTLLSRFSDSPIQIIKIICIYFLHNCPGMCNFI